MTDLLSPDDIHIYYADGGGATGVAYDITAHLGDISVVGTSITQTLMPLGTDTVETVPIGTGWSTRTSLAYYADDAQSGDLTNISSAETDGNIIVVLPDASRGIILPAFIADDAIGRAPLTIDPGRVLASNVQFLQRHASVIIPESTIAISPTSQTITGVLSAWHIYALVTSGTGSVQIGSGTAVTVGGNGLYEVEGGGLVGDQTATSTAGMTGWWLSGPPPSFD